LKSRDLFTHPPTPSRTHRSVEKDLEFFKDKTPFWLQGKEAPEQTPVVLYRSLQRQAQQKQQQTMQQEEDADASPCVSVPLRGDPQIPPPVPKVKRKGKGKKDDRKFIPKMERRRLLNQLWAERRDQMEKRIEAARKQRAAAMAATGSTDTEHPTLAKAIKEVQTLEDCSLALRRLQRAYDARVFRHTPRLRPSSSDNRYPSWLDDLFFEERDRPNPAPTHPDDFSFKDKSHLSGRKKDKKRNAIRLERLTQEVLHRANKQVAEIAAPPSAEELAKAAVSPGASESQSETEDASSSSPPPRQGDRHALPPRPVDTVQMVSEVFVPPYYIDILLVPTARDTEYLQKFKSLPRPVERVQEAPERLPRRREDEIRAKGTEHVKYLQRQMADEAEEALVNAREPFEEKWF